MDTENVVCTETTEVTNTDYSVWCEQICKIFTDYITCTSVRVDNKKLKGQCCVGDTWVLSNGPMFMQTNRYIKGIVDTTDTTDIEIYKSILTQLETCSYRTIPRKDVSNARKVYKENKLKYFEQVGMKRATMTAELKQAMQQTGMFNYTFIGTPNGYTFSTIYLQDMLQVAGLESVHLFIGILEDTNLNVRVPVLRIRGEFCTLWLFGRKVDDNITEGDGEFM